MKPTIGIIGGCGPLATIDIEYKILKTTRNLLSPLVDQDYFNLLIFNRTQFNDRNDVITFNEGTLFDQYLNCIKSLSLIGVDLLLIACQTAHVYLPRLQQEIKIPIIDIVQETVVYVRNISPNVSKVGLLATEATSNNLLYQNSLKAYNTEVVTVSQDIQKKLMEAIYIIKTGIDLVDNSIDQVNSCYSKINATDRLKLRNHPYKKVLLEKFLPNPISIIKEAITYLSKQGCKYIILGCTELPLILPYINIEKMDVILIDPNTIVANSIVYLANKLEHEKMHITV